MSEQFGIITNAETVDSTCIELDIEGNGNFTPCESNPIWFNNIAHKKLKGRVHYKANANNNMAIFVNGMLVSDGDGDTNFFTITNTGNMIEFEYIGDSVLFDHTFLLEIKTF